MTIKHEDALKLDPANKKFLGVCAGLANFLEVEAWTVRLVYIGMLIIGAWFLVPLYFVAWYFMDESSTKLRNTIRENHMVSHFKNVDYKKKLYRNPQEGKILGVCAGIADYLEISAFAVRMIVLLLAIFFFFPVLFYFGAALVIDKKPISAYYEEQVYTSSDEAASNNRPGADATAQTTVSGMAPDPGSRQSQRAARGRRGAGDPQYSKRREFQYCARKFATLQTRLARIEAYVTSSRFRLNREFRNIS